MEENKKPVVITCVGSGDSGKTSILIALAHHLVSTGVKVTMIGFDTEEESALERLLADTIAEGTPIPEATITDLIQMPPAYSGEGQQAIIKAIEEATIRHPAGFGIIRCDEALIGHELGDGDTYDLMRLMPNFEGVVLIDCASGTGGFSLLSAVAASTHVVGVAKPFPKSINIAKRAAGLIPNRDGDMMLELMSGIDEKTGLKYGARYLGLIGSMFQGAQFDGEKTVLASTGISYELRDHMKEIMDCPNFITHIPFVRGLDKRKIKEAHKLIAQYVAGAVGLPCQE